jgi:general stress protein 26
LAHPHRIGRPARSPLVLRPRDGDTVREALAHDDAYAVWQSTHLQAVIHGALVVSNDRERIEALWLDDEDLVFAGGPTDPNACLLCLTPRAVDVWQLSSLNPSAAAAPRRFAGSTLR